MDPNGRHMNDNHLSYTMWNNVTNTFYNNKENKYEKK